MNTLTLDIKTGSGVSIKTHGIFAYAQHNSTQVLCVTLKKNSDPPAVWLPPELRRPDIDSLSDDLLRRMLEEAEMIQAYNITTEFALWKYTLCRLYPWFPEVPVKKLSCLAARAAYLGMGFPVCTLLEKLGIPHNGKKTSSGGTVIFSDPAKKISNDSLLLLMKSCMNSVSAEADIAEKIPDLPPMEQKIWRTVLAMNNQGIFIPRKSLLDHLERYLAEEELLREEFYAITGIANPMNGDAVMAYFRQHDVSVKTLNRKDLDRTVRSLPQGMLRRAAEIRFRLAENRSLFCREMLSLQGADSRIRGLWEYHGYSSGSCRTKYLPDIGAVSGLAVPEGKNTFRILQLPVFQNIHSLWTNIPENFSPLIAERLKEYCIYAVLKPGATLYYGKLKFSCFSHFLKIVLPSGRDLYLYEPVSDKNQRLFCLFKYDRTAQKRELSGEMICRMIENAMKRDILMYYLTALMENDFTPVLFDSEELVTEDPVSAESDDAFNDLIACQPEWMKEAFRQPVMCLCRQWSKLS